MNWWEYVEQIADTTRQRDIADRTGIDEANVTRWKRIGQIPKPHMVAQFARAYGVSVIDAFVAAGFLTRDEAGEQPTFVPALNELTDDQLLAEVKTRLTERGQDNASQEPWSQKGSAPERKSAPPIGEWDKRHQELVIAEALQPEGIDTATPNPLRSVDDPSLSGDDGTNAGDQDDENGGRRRKRS